MNSHFVRIAIAIVGVWSAIGAAAFWWAARVPLSDSHAARFRSSFRVGVVVTVSWAVGSFVLMMWARRALVPADWIVGQVLTTVGGGLLGGSSAVLVGVAAGRMRWTYLRLRDGHKL